MTGAWRLKEELADFRVEELPEESPSGEGEHLWIEVEKRGLETEEVAQRLARAFDLQPGEVSYAGRKDRRGITRQRFSLRCPSDAALARLEGDGLRVLSAERHARKLRLGALRGNRFKLRVRGVLAHELEPLGVALARRAREGSPNAFGAQRYGAQGRGDEVGARLVRREWREALAAFAAAPHWPASAALDALREVLGREGREGHRGLARLATELPRELAAVARQLARRRGDFAGACRALERRTLSFALSAWQSRAFDAVLAARRGWRERVVEGDRLVRGGEGRAGLVSDVEAARGELAAGQASPTGPLFGWRAPLAGGAAGELEESILEELGARRGDLRRLLPGLDLPGARRALWVWPREVAVDGHEDGALVEFCLPAGAYATTLLAELEAEVRGAEGASLPPVAPRPGPM